MPQKPNARLDYHSFRHYPMWVMAIHQFWPSCSSTAGGAALRDIALRVNVIPLIGEATACLYPHE